MKVLIAGIDGYLGWALAVHLMKLGVHVLGIDNQFRRKSSGTLIPISPDYRREEYIQRLGSGPIFPTDISGKGGSSQLTTILDKHKPDTIVHLAQYPSAPYSMESPERAWDTQRNNVLGTLNLLYAMKKAAPKAHLVKLGTMGEYGTPDVDIPEGDFEVEYKGRKTTLPFPRQAGSWYHQSKVHDSHNIQMACRIWGLTCTDVMQGVVYGTRTDLQTEESVPEIEQTRFDINNTFGTVVNRFAAQALGEQPLTIYGTGHQRRAFLPLRDSIRCLTLAIDNPPTQGEYRVFNQFDRTYSILEIAEAVIDAAKLGLDIDSTYHKLRNPRVESENHYYNPECQKLKDLGYVPSSDLKDEVQIIMKDIRRYKRAARNYFITLSNQYAQWN